MDATMDKQKIAQCHTKAAQHHEKAAKCHQEAAKHQEAGNDEKAALEANKAHGHACCAKEHAAMAAKCCAGVECKTTQIISFKTLRVLGKKNPHSPSIYLQETCSREL